MADFHKSVLLRETIDLLRVKAGEKYIDATLGGGGHAQAIVEAGGIVLGIDVDPESISYVKETPKLKVVQGNFKDIDKIALLQSFDKAAGVIFDLGVSSRQIDEIERGFSYQREAPLDMRMNQGEKLPKAKDFLNLANADELYKIFNEFGEEPRSRALASAVVRARKIKAFETTSDLLKVIEEVHGLKGFISQKSRAAVAKRVFQALRIAVNLELESLKIALPKAIDLLKKHGRLAVISFHSLEDRIVKENFINFEKSGLGKIITKKPVIPGSEELKMNTRSKSAKLRVFERA